MNTAAGGLRIMSVVGARPQFVKLAAVSRAIGRYREAGRNIEDIIVHTGQHYDAGMSDVFFEELEIPRPDVDLRIGSAPHGLQTARMLEGIERLLLERRPQAVVVYGDTNSTLAGALAAAKLHTPVVHVEAGLRSFNRRMPEEVNRIVTDHLSDLLLGPTPTAMRNLRSEGLAQRAIFTGDVMFDAVRHAMARARDRSRILEELRLVPGQYAVATVHRAENTEPGPLLRVLTALNDIAGSEVPVVFPVHPRTRTAIEKDLHGWRPNERLRIIPPLGHLDMLALLASARLVLTDSGGLQKEAFFLGCPCITLRSETEWVETVEAGGNVVAGTEPQAIFAALDHWRRTPFDAERAARQGSAFFGTADSADRTVEAIVGLLRRS